MTKAIFWDNDGVLVDTERLYYVATQRALELEGIPLSKDQYIELFLVQGKGAWHLAVERGIAASRIDELRHERDQIFSTLLATEKLVIDGVRPVLHALHGRYSMGIVTSSEKPHFSLIHGKTDLLKYFEFVLASGDYPRSKPHPDPYLMAVERTGFEKDECLVIEDSARGLAAARAAGLRCIVVPSELTVGSDFTGAHRVLASLAELESVLD